jgi:hypothetical protein
VGLEELLNLSKQAKALASAPILSLALVLAGALIAWFFKTQALRAQLPGYALQPRLERSPPSSPPSKLLQPHVFIVKEAP